MSKKPALGKGLGALLQNSSGITPTSIGEKQSGSKEVKPADGEIHALALKDIEPNPFQPRTHFDEEALDELILSIKEHGVIQPITVRKKSGSKYQIISGERRYRASKAADLLKIPAYILNVDDNTMLEMAIVENVQRKDLNALEVALSYQRLIDECGITQEQVGKKVGKSRAVVTNYLRLLKLTSAAQQAIKENQISMGHAKSLASITNDAVQIRLLNKILKNGMSVRQVEHEVNVLKSDDAVKPGKKRNQKLSSEVLKKQEGLSFHLNTDIKINQDEQGKGKILIPFKDEAHLEKILELLDV